jgi:hypothetical protein
MRIVVTLAALSALFCAVFAGRILAGDETPSAALAATVPAANTQAECDTSVYHLEHAHAAQLVGRVKSLIAQITAYAADDEVAALPKSLVLLPTSSDDALIAICPRAQAGLVKDAIRSCDTVKQYAVKVQLFEVADNGKAIPVGGPHLLIGREGTVQCTTPEESLSVNFKVDAPVADANPHVPPAPCDPETAEVAGSEADVIGSAGRCHLDCPPPIGEMAVELGCGNCAEAGSAETAATESDGPACCENGTCTLTSGSCTVTSGSCSACQSGTCEACKSGTCAAGTTGTCAACKTGTCTGACCQAGCCHGQAAAGSCSASGCKCDGSCGHSNESAAATTSDEEVFTAAPACPNSGCPSATCFGSSFLGDTCQAGTCHASKQFSVGLGFGAGPGLQLIGPIVWFNKGTEPRCAACEENNQIADSDDGHDADADAVHIVPPPPADATPSPHLQFLVTQSGGSVIVTTVPAPMPADPGSVVVTAPPIVFEGPSQCSQSGLCPGQCQTAGQAVSSCTDGCTAVTSDEVTASPTANAPSLRGTIIYDHLELSPGEVCDPAKIAKYTNRLIEAKILKAGKDGIFFEQCQSPSQAGSSCTDGCPILITGQHDAILSPIAPCSCDEPEEGPQAPGAEPPALLTLSQHKEPSAALPTPHWQEELLQAFRGRRLSELFEPQPGQTAGAHEFGRLVAEFPKHPGTASTGHAGTHALTIVDLPGCIRIFETSTATGGHEGLSESAKTPILNTCPNCREEFRAYLEEMFRGSESSEDISQAGHHEADVKATEAARDLPSVTHSKIATITICYPLRDLVLCDDSGRPVFDTCTIIDHLQSAVSPETWSHPSVSIQLDQQTVSLVVTQTAEVHQKIAEHLRYLRRLQVKQICNLIERLSGDVAEESADNSAQADMVTPTADVELGPALPVGGK